jgi:hypothetical protein
LGNGISKPSSRKGDRESSNAFAIYFAAALLANASQRFRYRFQSPLSSGQSCLFWTVGY